MTDDSDDRRDPDRERLDERVEELEERVRELQAELGEPPRGPLGLPRPPTPREVLSFTGEYAIPTAIAVLEANLRALEALQRVIRVLDSERGVAREGSDRLERRAADASRATLDRLEDALDEVETAVRESDLPREGEARDILEDARRINREIRDRIERSRRDVDEARTREREGRDAVRPRRPSDEDTDFEERSTTIELNDGDDDGESGDRAQVDVDAELESIKDELKDREERANDGEESEAGDGESEDGGDDRAGEDGGGRAGGDESGEDGDGNESEGGRTDEPDGDGDES